MEPYLLRSIPDLGQHSIISIEAQFIDMHSRQWVLFRRSMTRVSRSSSLVLKTFCHPQNKFCRSRVPNYSTSRIYYTIPSQTSDFASRMTSLPRHQQYCCTRLNSTHCLLCISTNRASIEIMECLSEVRNTSEQVLFHE